MTLQEATALYGTRTYLSSKGDNINTIRRQIYNSDNSIYDLILLRLNSIISWDYLEPGTQINYLPESVCSQVYEV